MFDRPRNNDNVNFNRNYNDNVKTTKEKQVEVRAANIMQKLGATEESLKWYWKVCWTLSEGQVNNNLEQALKGNNPQKYFTWLCKRQMT